MSKMLNSFTEFETKYKVEEPVLHKFKALLEGNSALEAFLYVEGYDYYYTNSENSFIRYRKADHDLNPLAEITIKAKREEKHNVNRMEVNLKVCQDSHKEVEAFANFMDHHYNFKIWKSCHIYKLRDADVVFYTVRDDEGNLTNFIEIEVKFFSGLTEESAWGIIRKYELILNPIGVNAQKRLKKSLFEMYRKGPKNEKI